MDPIEDPLAGPGEGAVSPVPTDPGPLPPPSPQLGPSGLSAELRRSPGRRLLHAATLSSVTAIGVALGLPVASGTLTVISDAARGRHTLREKLAVERPVAVSPDGKPRPPTARPETLEERLRRLDGGAVAPPAAKPRDVPLSFSPLSFDFGAPAVGPGAVDAVVECRTETLKNLVSRGVSAETTDGAGTSLLAWAVRRRCLPAVKFLLSAGADPDRRAPNGYSPRKWAEVSGYVDAERMFAPPARAKGRK